MAGLPVLMVTAGGLQFPSRASAAVPEPGSEAVSVGFVVRARRRPPLSDLPSFANTILGNAKGMFSGMRSGRVGWRANYGWKISSFADISRSHPIKATFIHVLRLSLASGLHSALHTASI